MTFRLTFNKPAARQFIDGDEANSHLRIKIENGMVMFMPSKTAEHDTTELRPRTRGGYETIIDGKDSELVLKHLANPHGPFFTLHRHSKDWVVAEPYTGSDAPPKFESHVRVWSDNLPKHYSLAKPKTVLKVKSEPVIEIDPMNKIRWAYEIVNAPRGPGRPSNEFHKAKDIVSAFELEALNFVSKTGKCNFDPQNLGVIIDAYNSIGSFLEKASVVQHVEAKMVA